MFYNILYIKLLFLTLYKLRIKKYQTPDGNLTGIITALNLWSIGCENSLPGRHHPQEKRYATIPA
jgi:hypothetical protein